MDSQSTLQLLLNEAQQEVASLRSDLYSTRRLAEERRQAVQALTSERDAFKARLQQLEADFGATKTQLAHLQSAHQQLQALQEMHSKLQRDFDLSIAARRILESELADERKQRHVIEEAKALLEAERSKQVKAKDDLAASLRIAQRKAAEAEEEQLRAEEEAAAMRAELKALQAGALHTGADDVMPSSTAQAAPPDWQEQLEYERSRASTLMTSLHAVKAEVAALTQQQHAFQQQTPEHDAQTAQISHLQSEINSLKQQLADTQLHTHSLESQLASTQSQATELQQQCQRLQAHTPSPPQDPHSQSPPQGVDASNVSPSTSHQPHETNAGSSTGSAHLASSKPPTPPHHLQRQSTSGSAIPSELGGDAEAIILQKLQEQVCRLKASRDKLLEQVDKQWEEMDKLVAENKAASDELDAVRCASAGWEAQAQEGLAQAERLKEMLEEAARWSSEQAQGAVHGYVAAVNGTTTSPQELEAALLAEKARAADLELQLRALAAELLRSQQASMAIGKAVLPVLSGVEYRLTDMFSKARASHMSQRVLGQQGAAA